MSEINSNDGSLKCLVLFLQLFKSGHSSYVAISDDRSGTDSRSAAREWLIKQNIRKHISPI